MDKPTIKKIVFFVAVVMTMTTAVNIVRSATMQVIDGTFSSGGESNSSNFQLNGAISQIIIGQTATSSYDLRAGWLYFPMINTPIISATAGNGSVALSWTPAIGVLGWNVSGYSVGWATSVGGPYTFISSGASTNYTKSSLTNGTPYYFIIRVHDNFNTVITTSTEIAVTPVAPVVTCGNGSCSGGETCTTCPTDCGQCTGGGGGGGGGGAYIPPVIGDNAKATFKGRAYPLSDVSLIKDGKLIATTKSGPDAIFEISIANLVSGQYSFGVNSVDNLGNQSLTQTFPVTLTKDTTVVISGIFIAPSLILDKQEVKKGDNLAIFGRSTPESQIIIAVNSTNEIFAKATTDKAGAYLYVLDTSPLEMGDHSAKSKVSLNTEISSFSKEAAFKVGTKNVLSGPVKKFLKGDLNNDGRVNLTDFSIAAYWHKRTLTGAIIQTEADRLNSDGVINLVDFSIMAYYWTG